MEGNANSNKSSASDRKRLKCRIRRIELIEGEHPRIDISVDVDTSDTIDREIAALLHLGSAEVVQ